MYFIARYMEKIKEKEMEMENGNGSGNGNWNGKHVCLCRMTFCSYNRVLNPISVE